jgi:hypothetical protein
VNLNLSPASVAVLSQDADNLGVTMLGRIEIGMPKWNATTVSKRPEDYWVLSTPIADSHQLLRTTEKEPWVGWVNVRLEMIGNG